MSQLQENVRGTEKLYSLTHSVIWVLPQKEKIIFNLIDKNFTRPEMLHNLFRMNNIKINYWRLYNIQKIIYKHKWKILNEVTAIRVGTLKGFH